jgi:FtsP/CotA-like multicopper oxidase with cupredoxin domain
MAAGSAAVAIATSGSHPARALLPPRDRTGARSVDRDGFVEPRRIESRNGVLEATLRITPGTVDLGGFAHPGAINVNGAYLGPSLHVRAGDTMLVTLINELDEPANLHFHGLHVSPKGRSDNVFVTAAPGTKRHYEVRIPSDHTGGLNWYHSHIHGMSERQIDRGFSGMIHIDGGHTRIPELAALPRRFFAVSHLQLDAAGTVAPTPLVLTPVDDVTDSYDLVNGQIAPRLTMEPGSAEYWHFANFAGQWWYELSLEHHEFLLVAEDGNPLRKPRRVESLVLSPAKRFEVLVVAGDPGTYRLANAGHDVDGVFYDNASTLGTVEVTGNPVATRRLPRTLVDWPDLRRAPIANRRKIVFSEVISPFTRAGAAPSLEHMSHDMPGMRNVELEQAIAYNMTFDFFLNGRRYDPEVTNTRVHVGDVEEWELVNDSTTDHPFHIHTNPFQVIERNGQPVESESMRDVGILDKAGSLKFLIRFADFDGLTLYHCHNLFHEDQGMMATIRILPAT